MCFMVCMYIPFALSVTDTRKPFRKGNFIGVGDDLVLNFRNIPLVAV